MNEVEVEWEIEYDGTEGCKQELLKKDLYVTSFVDGLHLCEMYSLNVSKDYGPISVGDVVSILAPDSKVVVFRKKGLEDEGQS